MFGLGVTGAVLVYVGYVLLTILALRVWYRKGKRRGKELVMEQMFVQKSFYISHFGEKHKYIRKDLAEKAMSDAVSDVLRLPPKECGAIPIGISNIGDIARSISMYEKFAKTQKEPEEKGRDLSAELDAFAKQAYARIVSLERKDIEGRRSVGKILEDQNQNIKCLNDSLAALAGKVQDAGESELECVSKALSTEDDHGKRLSAIENILFPETKQAVKANIQSIVGLGESIEAVNARVGSLKKLCDDIGYNVMQLQKDREESVALSPKVVAGLVSDIKSMDKRIVELQHYTGMREKN